MTIDINNLEHALLATNASPAGIKHMELCRSNFDSAEGDFYKHCYVEADFDAWFNFDGRDRQDLNERQDHDLNIKNDFDLTKYINNIRKNRYIYDKKSFEDDLLGVNPTDSTHRTYSTVFLIEGPSGCGKTTYGKQLLIKHGSKYQYLDFEHATNINFRIFGQEFNLSDDPYIEINPFMAMQGLLVKSIHDMLHEPQEEDRFSFLQIIYNIYRKYFKSEIITIADSFPYKQFFDILNKYTLTENYNEFGKEVTEYFHDLINKDKEIENNKDKKFDFVPSIKSFFGIVMRLYFCIAKSKSEKRLLFIDNIERYIVREANRPYVAVFDFHIEKIMTSLYIEAGQFEDKIHSIYEEFNNATNKKKHGEKYVTTFGILIALREITVHHLIRNRIFLKSYAIHRADNSPTYLNLSRAFNFKVIIDKKIDYFISSKIDETECTEDYIALTSSLDNIFDDKTISKWALRNLVLGLFNYDFRKFVKSIIGAFKDNPSYFKEFNRLWIEQKQYDVKRTNSQTQEDRGNYIKHICRQLILRTLLDYIHNVKTETNAPKYFDSLLTRLKIGELPNDDNESDPRDKSTYLNNMLIYLHNRLFKTDDFLKNPNFTSFPKLIKTLLLKPNLHETKLKTDPFTDIAQILDIANETAIVNTHINDLIMINLDTDWKASENLESRLKDIWQKYLTTKSKEFRDQIQQNIKITPAGSIIAMISPCFEYFACRYRPGSKPLIMVTKEEERRKLLFGNGNFLKGKLSASDDFGDVGIVERAFNCVDFTIEFETRMFQKFQGKHNKPKFGNHNFIYKDKDLPLNKKGMVHPLRILVEHCNYLQDYRRYLIETENKSYETEIYKTPDKMNIGSVDKAIELYQKKINDIIKYHSEYVNLGALPNISYQ